MKWYFRAIWKYAAFTGRARRSEYWYFTLFNILFTLLAMLTDNVLGTTFIPESGTLKVFGYVYVIYTAALSIPTLAVSVRRLHDIGRSGWMLLVGLIPIFGSLWLFYEFCEDSNIGENSYGTNPKTVAA
jgi:uncharacterized membrane protein YhaH (DUF805 family)